MNSQIKKPRFKFEPDIISIIGLILMGMGILSQIFRLEIYSHWVHSKARGSQYSEAVQVPSWYLILLGLAIILIMNWPLKEEESNFQNRIRNKLKKKKVIKPGK